MTRRAAAVTLALMLSITAAGRAAGEVQPLAVGGFAVQQEVVVPGTPEEAFDAFTGDITGWWNQSFSAEPLQIVLDPRPGGAFYELFDDQGNGAVHATVIFVQRGQRLRFRGQMGYSGYPVDMVHTVDFLEGDQGTTRLLLGIRAAGQLEKDWAEGVDRVWRQILAERFKPYMEALRQAAAEPPPPAEP